MQHLINWALNEHKEKQQREHEECLPRDDVIFQRAIITIISPFCKNLKWPVGNIEFSMSSGRICCTKKANDDIKLKRMIMDFARRSPIILLYSKLFGLWGSVERCRIYNVFMIITKWFIFLMFLEFKSNIDWNKMCNQLIFQNFFYLKTWKWA